MCSGWIAFNLNSTKLFEIRTNTVEHANTIYNNLLVFAVISGSAIKVEEEMVVGVDCDVDAEPIAKRGRKEDHEMGGATATAEEMVVLGIDDGPGPGGQGGGGPGAGGPGAGGKGGEDMGDVRGSPQELSAKLAEGMTSMEAVLLDEELDVKVRNYLFGNNLIFFYIHTPSNVYSSFESQQD